METTAIDQLFLELSQVTKATTKKESDFAATLRHEADHALDLCHEIEKLPASPQQTAVSIMAANLRKRLWQAAYPGQEFTS